MVSVADYLHRFSNDVLQHEHVGPEDEQYLYEIHSVLWERAGSNRRWRPMKFWGGIERTFCISCAADAESYVRGCRLKRKNKNQSREKVYITLNKSADTATAVANDPDEVDMYKGREMVLEPGAQLCMINSCRETKKEQ
jgi:hypothetical protein